MFVLVYTYSSGKLSLKRVRWTNDEDASGGYEAWKTVEECVRSVQSTDEVRRQHAVKLTDVQRQTARVTALETNPASILTHRHYQLSLSSLSKAQKPHHHNRFTALFPGLPRWTGARRELLDFMVQGKINRGRHTDHPAGRHSIRTNQCPPPPSPISFYRPDALPAAQTTVSKHWRL